MTDSYMREGESGRYVMQGRYRRPGRKPWVDVQPMPDGITRKDAIITLHKKRAEAPNLEWRLVFRIVTEEVIDQEPDRNT